MKTKNADSEIVDIVDDNGKRLYHIEKKVAHQKGLLHKTVIAEVRNSKEKFLLNMNLLVASYDVSKLSF